MKISARVLTALIAFFILGTGFSSRAPAAAFDTLQEELWPEAQKAGIRREIFDAAFAGLAPDPEVLQLAGHQPEFTLTPAQYLEHIITPERLADGTKAYRKYARPLAVLERRYGVSRFILLAIWGVELDFGTKCGTRNVIRSLATLATSGNRAAFAKAQLIEALKFSKRVTLRSRTWRAPGLAPWDIRNSFRPHITSLRSVMPEARSATSGRTLPTRWLRRRITLNNRAGKGAAPGDTQ